MGRFPSSFIITLPSSFSVVRIFVVLRFSLPPQFAFLLVFLFDPRRRRCTGLTGIIEVNLQLAALIVVCDGQFLPSVYFSP